MTTLHSIFAALIVTSAAVSASAAPETQTDTTRYNFQVVSTATSHFCDASQGFSQTITLCGSEGCTSLDVAERSQIAFDAPRGGRVAVVTSAVYERDGVVYGDSEIDELRTGQDARFVHTVIGSNGCMKSVVYSVTPAAE